MAHGMKLLKEKIVELRIAQEALKKMPRAVVEQRQDDILEDVREQLLDGLRGDGKEISPSYLNDPYFETRPRAVAYMNWKKTISRPSKPAQTPDLFINGMFHSQLGVIADVDSFFITGITPYAQSISSKYENVTFGLTEENLSRFRQNYINPMAWEIINKL